MIEQGLIQFLKADFGIQQIFSNANFASPRVFGVMLPAKDNQLPAIVFSTVSYRPIESLRGPNILELRRMQFDCYGRNFIESRQLSKAVKAVLFPPDADGNPTSLKAQLPDGTGVDATNIILDIDKPYEEGEGGYVFCAVLDIEISFVNAA